MSDILKLPYFSRQDNAIFYLDQYEYLDLDGINIASPAGERLLLAEGVNVKMPSIPVPSQPSNERIVILEPHPDDFALSASGYGMNTIASGSVCHVINLFSRTTIARFPWQNKVTINEEMLEELRLQESQLAVGSFLGQEFTSLRLPLASKRGYDEIFAERHHDQVLVQHIGGLLTSMIVELDTKTILCPLAIQGHIDHLVTFDVGMFIKDALGNQVNLVLYEDYPYARNKNAYAKRLLEVSVDHRLTQEYIAVDENLNTMADMAIIYRSQFDDINRDQMYAIMREDTRATSLEAKAEGINMKAEHMQRYWRVYEN